jgi:hypothetical protein
MQHGPLPLAVTGTTTTTYHKISRRTGCWNRVLKKTGGPTCRCSAVPRRPPGRRMSSCTCHVRTCTCVQLSAVWLCTEEETKRNCLLVLLQCVERTGRASFLSFFFTLYAWPCKVIMAVCVFVSRWWRSPYIFNDAAVARFSVFNDQRHLVMLPITAKLVIRDRVDSDSREFSYYSLTYLYSSLCRLCVWLGCVLAHRCYL